MKLIIFLSFLILAISSIDAGSDSTPHCLEYCPDIWQPICVSDGENLITFGNQCEFNNYICRKGGGELKDFD